MPNLPHLILPRAEFDLPRKKTGFGRAPAREHGSHGQELAAELQEVLRAFRARTRPAGINPSLILRVRLNPQAGIDEDAWERGGLTLLSADQDKTLVLFSSDADLSDFRRRLTEYQQGPPPEQKSPPHAQVFAAIDQISEIHPEDRIGRLMCAEGVNSLAAIDEDRNYIVDVELWDLGTRDSNRGKVEELRRFIAARGGRVSDDYVGESLVLLRAHCSGSVLKEILDVECVALVDLPPRPTLAVSQLLDVGIEDLPSVEAPAGGAPGVAILDSGVTIGHPLLGPAVGEATTVPRTWGDAADGNGHGTMVAGLALYGDVEKCIVSRAFVPRLTLYSARVLNDQCRFDNENLITTQMRQAIAYFRETYGCRVFNVSLGDDRLPYQGGKVGPWAAILDTLARELDVVIVVSAGNYTYNPSDRGETPDGWLQQYPAYLLRDNARIIEPATAAIALTVGALADKADLPPGSASSSVSFRPIAQIWQPSPFTRRGPGLGGAVKPDFCEVGGNRAYSGLVRGAHDVRELSVVSMSRQYLERLFSTDYGTSFAAPRVAHAAARLYEWFPTASANLIRALLASSASVPAASLDLLRPLGDGAVLQVCGYGLPDLDAARASDDRRVVLYAESRLAFDNFHIYEVPIPEEFVAENGARWITVTLAYDPPVRHTRFDYLGVKMSFRLIRGKSASEIAEAFRSRSREEQQVDPLTSTRYDCHPMEPKATEREGGTLQKATFTMQRNPTAYGNTYHVVVRCEKKWARDEHAPQRYAVVVVVEHSARVDLYSRIRERVQERIRLRGRT